MAPASRSTRKPAVSAPSKVRKSHASLAPIKRVIHEKVVRAVNLNYERGRYPWDDFQDEIIINSVEVPYLGSRKPLAGVAHYLQQLSHQKEPYKHICTHPDEYRKLPDHVSEPDEEEDADSDSGSETDPGINYTVAAKPPPNLEHYEQPIYEAEILNPAVFLAVVRIAQKNYPFLEYVSALGHLPNLPVDAPLPKLPKAVFPETVPYATARSATAFTLLFLPTFWADGRHALGYYEITDDKDPRMATCFFTPCTTADLVKFNLVQWYSGRNARGVENMKSVGGKEGDWLHPDVVEEWEDWKFSVRVVGRMWQERLNLYLGGEEDGGRA